MRTQQQKKQPVTFETTPPDQGGRRAERIGATRGRREGVVDMDKIVYETVPFDLVVRHDGKVLIVEDCTEDGLDITKTQLGQLVWSFTRSKFEPTE